ncbi:MAG: hypothetical protein ACXVUL_15005 [Solirubrobacteraceae bacterium]
MRKRGAVVLVSMAATLGAGLAAGTAAQAATSRVAIHGTASPAASRTPRVGSVAGNTSMDFQVIMKLPDQAAADQFAQAATTPGNAQYVIS